MALGSPHRIHEHQEPGAGAPGPQGGSNLSKWNIAAALIVAAGGCSEPSCCIDDYPASYALLYGTVRLASQAPASNTLVRAGDGSGVRTDAAGRYRLPTTMHGVSARTSLLAVQVFRSDAQGRLVDSSAVQAQVPFFSTQPPRDSVQVNIITPWTQ